MLILDSIRAEARRMGEKHQRLRQKLKDAENTARNSQQSALAPDGDRPVSTLEAAMGFGLHHDEVCRRLRKCNANLYFEVSPGTGRIGVYYPDSSSKGTPTRAGVRYLGTSFNRGMVPEFTPKLEENGKVVSISAGYRTVLARLIRGGYITRAIAERVFPQSRDSMNWQRLTT